MNDKEIRIYLEGLLQDDLNQLSDNAYRAKMQLKSFSKEEYNRRFRYGTMLSPDEYVEELQSIIEARHKKVKIVNEIIIWLDKKCS